MSGNAPRGYVEKSPACTANNQSPVDLVRSPATLPCRRKCDFFVDPVETQTGTVRKYGSYVMVLDSMTSPPTATYNNIKYGCSKIELYGTAQHSYSGQFSQFELVATFTSPGYKPVMMSVPVNETGATDTPSTKFFNAFVGHTDSQSKISLGRSWSLQNAVPADMSYFVYEGRDFFCTTEVTWIVYNNPIQINGTDSYAVKNALTSTWRKPLQQLSKPGDPDERHVYFKSATEENPAYMQKDGKVYMKCRRLNTKGQVAGEEGFDNMREGFFGGAIEGLENPPPTVSLGGVKAKEKKEKDAQTALVAKNVWATIYGYYLQFGGLWGILLLIFGVAFTILLQTTWSTTIDETFDWIMTIPNFIHEFLFG